MTLSSQRRLPRGRGFSKLPVHLTVLFSSSVLLPGSLQEGVGELFSFYLDIGYLSPSPCLLG